MTFSAFLCLFSPRRFRPAGVRVATAGLTLLAAPVHGQVVTNYWLTDVAAGSGNWSNGLLWSVAPPLPRLQAPQSGENVTIENGLLFPAIVSLDTDATVAVLNLGSGATLAINNGRSLTFAQNSVINGTLTLNASSNNTDLIASGAVTLSGSGVITLGGSAQNRLRGASGGTLTNQITIQGGGLVGASSLTIYNQGVIAANAASPMVLEPNSGGIINTGTLRATGGATLLVKKETVANTGGVIEAQNASTVQLDTPTITGGTLSTVGTGKIDVIGSTTFQGVTLSSGSVLNLLDGVAATISGSFINNGTFNLNASGSDTDLKFSGAVTLGGTGTITLSDSAKNRIYASGSSSLTLGANQTLSGAGKLGRNNLGITNQGTIVASGTAALEIDNDGNAFTNQGTLRAVGTGGMSIIDSSVTNQGNIEVATSFSVNNAFVQSGAGSMMKLLGGSISANSFAFNAGSLSGTGTVNGSTTISAASVFPGGSGTIGTLTFNQPLTLGASSLVTFDLGGVTAGTGHDRINGTSITLGGTLALTFASGFASSITSSDTLTLIQTTTGLSGLFSGLANGTRLTTTDGLGSFQVNYFANSVTVSDFQAIPEPSTYALLGLGATAVLWVGRRRRRRASR